MRRNNNWPKGITQWVDERTLHMSVPFSWNVAESVGICLQASMEWDTVLIGGPAIQYLVETGGLEGLPFPDHVAVGSDAPGVLQRINPNATRTTVGCPNHCPFCLVPMIEGTLRELDDWPDQPVLIDNNLFAASQEHLDKVFDRLEPWERVDFNQGLEARRMTDYHAERLARLTKPSIRLALDRPGEQDAWERAWHLLRKHGIPKSAITSYALIGFDSSPDEAVTRLDWLEAHGINVMAMWFHELDAPHRNAVTTRQRALGWTDYERRRIMQWYWKRKKAKRYAHDKEQPYASAIDRAPKRTFMVGRSPRRRSTAADR